MNDDAELLLRYARERSEEAMTELVRRHLPLIYHAALRQVRGNTHLAQEAAQEVIIAMARKAASLAKAPSLTGWLYVSACYSARKLIRSAERRQHWEQQAMETHSPEVEWHRIRPEIDALMLKLGDGDRAALLMRFFEGMRLSEIGRQLGISDDGARLRVDRALEKLRQLLARRGITSTGTALGSALAAHAAQPISAGLAATITASATAQLAAGTGAATGTAAALKVLIMSKSTVTICAVLAVAAGSAYYLRPTSASSSRPVPNLSSTPPTLPLPSVIGGAPAPRESSPAPRPTELRPHSAQEPATLTAAVPGAGGDAARETKLRGDLQQGFFKIDELAPLGADSPREAVVSFRWALEHGGFNDIATMIEMAPEDKKNVEAILATLPESTRSKYPDAEHLFALYGARDAAIAYPPSGTVRIVSENITEADGNGQIAHVRLQYDQGLRDQLDQQNHEDFDLRKTATGWKIVVPGSAVKSVTQWLTTGETTGKEK